MEKDQIRPSAPWSNGRKNLGRRHLGPPNIVEHYGREDDGSVGLGVRFQQGTGETNCIQCVRVSVSHTKQRSSELPHCLKSRVQDDDTLGFRFNAARDIVPVMVRCRLKLGHAVTLLHPLRSLQAEPSARWNNPSGPEQ